MALTWIATMLYYKPQRPEQARANNLNAPTKVQQHQRGRLEGAHAVTCTPPSSSLHQCPHEGFPQGTR